MSYVLTVSQNGSVIEDNYVLPALSLSQPWAAQILAPIRSVPVFAGQSYLPVRVILDQPIVMSFVVSQPSKKLKTLAPSKKSEPSSLSSVENVFRLAPGKN